MSATSVKKFLEVFAFEPIKPKSVAIICKALSKFTLYNFFTSCQQLNVPYLKSCNNKFPLVDITIPLAVGLALNYAIVAAVTAWVASKWNAIKI